MQTLYIDVYFLINFTVDLIALYFASIFSKVPTSIKRLVFASVIGAFTSVFYILSPEKAMLKIIISLVGLLLISVVCAGRVRFFRKIKLTFAFLIFGAMLGAAVYYIYGVFDKYLYSYLSVESEGVQNRRLLLFSLIVLLSIGVFKMLVSFFSNSESAGACTLEIALFDKCIKTEAFIDSGNLAIDPMDMRPVLLIKEEIAKKLLPDSVIDLTDPDLIDKRLRKRIRLIPITRGGVTHVLTGVRADKVTVEDREELFVTVAIDKEGGDFGGYLALLPSSAIAGTGISKR